MKFFKEKAEGQFEIVPAVRDLVSFRYLNLAEDAYPAPENDTAAMDVIFCRNVLMYFSADKARTAAEKLARSLVEGGFLVSSPCEGSEALFEPLVSADFPGAILYRKLKAGEAPHRPPRVAPPLPAATARISVPPPPAAIKPEPEKKTAAPPVAPAPKSAASRELAAQARTAANRGDLAGALRLCDEAISADKVLAVNHYLRGVILQEQGALDEAVNSLKRAIYLDQSFTLALFALGNILRQGSRRESDRLLASAGVLLRRMPSDSPVPESEGMTAGRLLEIIEGMEKK